MVRALSIVSPATKEGKRRQKKTLPTPAGTCRHQSAVMTLGAHVGSDGAEPTKRQCNYVHSESFNGHTGKIVGFLQ